MIINHNMGAANAIRQMGINQTSANKSMEKLSSGLRINRAGDDAAGLAISEKMRGQIRGLDQASSNAQDGISLIQTAEGALNETTSILQRMRELSVQASNDTNNDTDRGQIQKEVDQLTSEIDRIGNNTEFNTKTLLNGTSGKNAELTASTATGNAVKILSTGTLALGGTYSGITVTTAATKTTTAAGAADTTVNGSASNLVLNGVSFDFAAGTTATDMAATINAKSSEIGFTASVSGGTKLTFQANDYGSGNSLTATGTASSMVGAATAGVNTVISAATLPAGTTASVSDSKHGSVITLNGGALDGTIINTAGTTAADTFELTVADKSLTFQIGANANQNITVGINDMRAAALGVNNLDVTSAKSATNAVTTIQTAIDKVSSERAKLGAYSNRLEHTIANLGTSSENMTAAESRIRDVDMAKEMSAFSKNNILSQAAQAMLAQANQQPQQVLQLLR